MRRFGSVGAHGRATLLAAMVLGGATGGRADVVASPEFQVNTYTTGPQESPAVCRAADGRFVVVWGRPDLGGDEDIVAQRFDPAGAPQGSEFQVNEYTTDTQNVPTVCCDRAGDFVVTFHDGSGRDGDTDGVFARRFGSGGTPLGSEFRVNTYTTGSQNVPRIACGPSGDFVIAWESPQDLDATGVVAQRYDSAGNVLGTEFLLTAYTTGTQSRPSPALDASGRLVVTWRDVTRDGDGFGIFGRRWGSDGTPLGTEFQANTYTTGSQSRPFVSANSAGDFVVAWQGEYQDGDAYGIFARRYDSAGTPLGPEFQVNTYTTGDQYRRSAFVALDDTGSFTLAWNSRNAGEDPDGGVFAQRFDSGGARWGSEFRVNTYTTGSQYGPTIAADRDGDFVVAWEDPARDGSDSGVFARGFADPCGDGVVGPGEACDDGSRLAGDCCSATCQLVGSGIACDADGVDCTTDVCDGAGACGVSDQAACPACRVCDRTLGCVARPRTDCRKPTRARAALLALRDKTPDTRDRVAFAWRRGAALDPADLGSPTADTPWDLCIFDRAGGVDRLVLDARAAGGSRWKKRGRRGFRYRQKSGAPDGLTAVDLRAGAAGRSQAKAAARGAALGFPAFPLTPPLTAELQAGNDGACVAATFAAPRKNTATRLKAKGD